MSSERHGSDQLSDLEQALADQLHCRSQRAPVHAVRRSGVEDRLVEREATRRRRRTMVRGGLAASSVAVFGALAVLAAPRLDGGSTVVSEGSASPPPTAITSPSPLSPTPAGAVPQLGLDAAHWDPAYASSDTSEGRPPVPGQTKSHTVQVYRDPAEDLVGPFLHVNVAPSDAYSLGEFPAAEEVPLPGRQARLVEGPSGLLRIGWEAPQGVTIDVEAFGLSREELVDVAEAMQPVAPDERRWELPVLPAGMELVEVAVLDMVEDSGMPGAMFPTVSSSYDSLRYEGPGGDLEFHVMDGPEPFESRLSDRLDSAVSIEALEVRGHPGVLIDVGPDGDGHRYWVLWEESDTVTVEIDITVASEQAVRDLLPSIVELDEATWQDLLNEFSPQTSSR